MLARERGCHTYAHRKGSCPTSDDPAGRCAQTCQSGGSQRCTGTPRCLGSWSSPRWCARWQWALGSHSVQLWWDGGRESIKEKLIESGVELRWVLEKGPSTQPCFMPPPPFPREQRSRSDFRNPRWDRKGIMGTMIPNTKAAVRMTRLSELFLCLCTDHCSSKSLGLLWFEYVPKASCIGSLVPSL